MNQKKDTRQKVLLIILK